MNISGLLSFLFFVALLVLLYRVGVHFLTVTLGWGSGDTPRYPGGSQVAYRSREELGGGNPNKANPYTADYSAGGSSTYGSSASGSPTSSYSSASSTASPEFEEENHKWAALGLDIPGEMAITIAGPGSGKNETILRPKAYEILTERDQHLVINDPKGEELGKLARTGALDEANVWVFSADPNQPSSFIDPLTDFGNAAAFLQTVIKREGVSDPHWQDAAVDLALAICEGAGWPDLAGLYDIARSESKLDELAADHEGVYEAYSSRSERERSSIRSSLLTPLAPLRDPAIRRMFDTKTRSAGPPNKQPNFGYTGRRTAVFFQPPVFAAAAQAAEAIYAGLFDHLFRLSVEGRRRGGPGTYWLIDEAASVMSLKNLRSYINSGRGMEQRMMTVLQDVSQLASSVGWDNAQSIIGSCDVQFWGRTADTKTAEMLERISGTVRVQRRVFQDADQGAMTQWLNDWRGDTLSHLHEEERAAVRSQDLIQLAKFHWYLFAQGYIELVEAAPWYEYAGKLDAGRSVDELRIMNS